VRSFIQHTAAHHKSFPVFALAHSQLFEIFHPDLQNHLFSPFIFLS
jgi:hypothetical protein